MYNPVIKQTEKEWIKNNISNSFSRMFLTMLSIIQGVALSFLVIRIPITIDKWHAAFSMDNINILLKNAITFLLIITLWHSYFWLAAIAKWIPLIWDSLFMYLIGMIELIIVKNIGNPIWFYAVVLLGILGGLQYRYNVARLSEEVWANDTKENNLGLENDIGQHIRTYKTNRGNRLVDISILILVFTVHFHLFFPNCLWVILLVMLFGQCWALWKHLSDQKTTLRHIGTIAT